MRRQRGVIPREWKTPPRVNGWHVNHQCDGRQRDVAAARRPDGKTSLLCLWCGESLEVVKRVPILSKPPTN